MENKKKPNKVNMPRFNMSWMYMIIALMLWDYTLPMKAAQSTKKLRMISFSNM